MAAPFDYQIIRSRRSSISLQVTRQGQVVVRAPVLAPKPVIDRFVESKAAWVEKHLSQLRYTGRLSRQQTYTDGAKFLYLGRFYPLHFGNFRTIHVNHALNVPVGMKFRIRTEIRGWYKRTASAYIAKRTQEYATSMSVQYSGIRFSDTSSKWGSCTRDNYLQFSWRLIMAPQLVVDYVIVHELAHTREKNHGRKFWGIVGKYKPAYRQYVKWLRENSALVHAQL